MDLLRAYPRDAKANKGLEELKLEKEVYLKQIEEMYRKRLKQLKHGQKSDLIKTLREMKELDIKLHPHELKLLDLKDTLEDIQQKETETKVWFD